MTHSKKPNLLEVEHNLITPDFVGTDEEKIKVLNYWAELIGTIRALNANVISSDNKIAIIHQLKHELDLLDLENSNMSAVPVGNVDGSTEMRKSNLKPEEEPSIDLTKEDKPKKSEDFFKAPPLSPEATAKKLAGIR